MLLTGTHSRTLDEKKRLAMPKRIRELLGEPESLFVTLGPDQSLWLYTKADFERTASKFDELPATDAEVRSYGRLFFGRTEQVDMDRNGRILIPERLLQMAGLEHNVVLIGVRDHLELWDADKWRQFEETNAPRFDSIAENAFRK